VHGAGAPLNRLKRRAKAQSLEHDSAIRGDLQPRAHFSQRGGLFQNRHLCPSAGKGQSRRQATDSAADDGNRATITPQSARYPLREIQQALVAFRQRANLALGLHWCLLPGVNDGDEDVRGIAAFAAPLGRCFVHVIPYNPGTAPIARAPSDDEVRAFIGRLRAAGLAVRRRITKGRDVMAACGQLGAPGRAGP
jgi:adenine C2-methylase RlmN of 23S rRNA A2503 and tRNA A37